MPGPAGNFCWQMPRPPFLRWWSNARPPSPSDQYTKSLVAIFTKHNCFSSIMSIELHKTGHEMSHSDWKKDKANGSIAFIGLLWSINALHLLQNGNAWLLETLNWAPSEMTKNYETSFFLFANARGAGTLSTATECSAPGTHRATNARGLPGGVCSRLELTRA